MVEKNVFFRVGTSSVLCGISSYKRYVRPRFRFCPFINEVTSGLQSSPLCRSARPHDSSPSTQNCSTSSCAVLRHRRSQGVQWVHLHSQGGEKFFSGVIYRENV